LRGTIPGSKELRTKNLLLKADNSLFEKRLSEGFRRRIIRGVTEHMAAKIKERRKLKKATKNTQTA
jgi:hypothetical protein